MSLNKKNVAAYLFLPQFHLSFQGMSHLYPVFMRVMALMFTQAGILPNNHPATRYGIAGVKKYGVGELIGEGWYNLRNRRGATPYQWGVFASILLMLGAFVGAIANFIFTVAFGVGSAAQAQLFSNPLIPDTSIGFVQAGPGAGAVPFDKRIGMGAEDGNYIYNDYALIMLDKILRSSAATPQRGGSMQNGITALFQVYNTAITVIAAIMIFWIIVSIVVDTAKTGTIGGGRHNMVWAPIRIVFALGLMIPLGTVGYSSGQYCVMKLAEWGSNLGTNGWNAYVTAVIGLQDMLAPVAPENVSGIINGIVASQVCAVAYNTYVEQSTGTTATSTRTPDPSVLIGPINSISADRAGMQRAWTNSQEGNLCGMIVLPIGDGTMMGLPAGDDASRVLAQLAGTSLGSAGYGTAINAARNAAINMLSVPIMTAIEPLAREFACAYVPHTIGANAGAGWAAVNTARNATGPGFGSTWAMGGVDAFGGPAFGFGATSGGFRTPTLTMGGPGSMCSGTNTANPCAPAAIGPPGPGPFPPKPTLSCHMFMNVVVSGGAGFIGAAINAAAAILNGYITGAGANSMVGNMMTRGWGGMGTFMNELASINIAHQANGLPSITVIPGTLASGAAECFGGDKGGTTACKLTGIARSTAETISLYQSWYEKLSAQSMVMTAAATALNLTSPATPGTYSGTGDMLQEQAEQMDKPAMPGMLKMAYWCATGQCAKAMEAVVKRMFGLDNKRDYLWTNLVGGIADRTYPLVNMVVVGNKMAVRGGVVLAAATVVQTAVGAFLPGLGLAGSIIFDFARSMAYAMMTTGLLLTIYVPVLPTVRVSFSVLTWMVCVFEAVVMVPIACLAHLTTEQEGLAGAAKGCWVMWLNVLTRPILSVFGFIGAFLIFNAWVVYFTDVFATACMQATAQSNIIMQILCQQAYSMIYVTLCYSTANASFKLMDQLPNALFKWLPFGGSGQEGYGDDSAAQKQVTEMASKTAAGLEGSAGLLGKEIGKQLVEKYPKAGVKYV